LTGTTDHVQKDHRPSPRRVMRIYGWQRTVRRRGGCGLFSAKRGQRHRRETYRSTFKKGSSSLILGEH